MGSIWAHVEAMGSGPLTAEGLRRHVHPLFSRVLKRSEIYLSNHSLGRPLDQTAADIAEFAALWADTMDDAWGPWMDEITRFRTSIAGLLTLPRHDCVTPRVSAGQGLRAVLNALPMQRPVIVATRGEFDSMDFILKTYAHRGRAEVHWVEPDRAAADQPPIQSADRVIQTIRSLPRVDLVLVSHVYYATGQVLDGVERVIEEAHARGGLAVLDTYHSLGVIAVDLPRLNADFAIGGCYKYLRGGPGGGFLAVHPRHLRDDGSESPLRTLDTGWFAKRDTFGFQRPDEPLLAPGGDAWMEATPSPLLAYQCRAGLEFVQAMGVSRLREYSLKQISQLSSELEQRGVSVRRPAQAGAFVLVPHANAPGAVDALKAAGVSADARLGFVRLCPDVLNTTEELSRAADIVARVWKSQ